MQFDQIPAIVASLAGTAIGAFVVSVLVDDALGVALAIKHKAFDVHALPSFLISQFGTKEAVALAGLVITASLSGGDVKQVALAAATAGATAMTATVLADCKDKMRQIVVGV
jgi:hypothetical protein